MRTCSLLERRLDGGWYRLGFASTRAEGRQLVLHRHVLVNGRRVNIPSYVVAGRRSGLIREKSREIPRIKESVEGAERRGRLLARARPGELHRHREDLPSAVENNAVAIKRTAHRRVLQPLM